jgi:hypothetical protein
VVVDMVVLLFVSMSLIVVVVLFVVVGWEVIVLELKSFVVEGVFVRVVYDRHFRRRHFCLSLMLFVVFGCRRYV